MPPLRWPSYGHAAAAEHAMSPPAIGGYAWSRAALAPEAKTPETLNQTSATCSPYCPVAGGQNDGARPLTGARRVGDLSSGTATERSSRTTADLSTQRASGT